MEWEKPYMEKCIEYLEPSGTILEIGFGMGYSAEKIVSFDSVTSYTVIECSPQVWEKYEIFKEKMRQTRPDLNINIINIIFYINVLPSSQFTQGFIRL